jgi:hypothetical protein
LQHAGGRQGIWNTDWHEKLSTIIMGLMSSAVSVAEKKRLTEESVTSNIN